MGKRAEILDWKLREKWQAKPEFSPKPLSNPSWTLTLVMHIHFCYHLALETSAKYSSISLSGVMTSATPTHSQAYNGQGPLASERFSRLKAAYSARNGAHKKAEEPYLHPFVSKRREMLKPVPTKAFLQPAKAAAMCTAPRIETCPPPPIPPFLLAQNLSSKRIVPTDNMRPKFHDEYTHHQWLKGFNMRQGCTHSSTHQMRHLACT